MNKKVMATAVLAALAAPGLVFAQASTVQIYGRINHGWDSVNQGGITKDGLSNSGGSNIGFKGTESLGGGLTAWFQGEQTMEISSATSAATTNFDRNSGVGLQGGFGNVMFGNWDMPMKWTTVSGIVIADTGRMGSRALLSGGAPTSVNARSSMSFYRREQNSIQYWSPNMSGFEVRFGMTAADHRTGTQGAGNVTTVTTGTPRVYSLGAMYNNGPLQVGLGYERHQDAAGTAATTLKTDTGWTLSAGYTIAGKFRLSGMYERLKWESATLAAGGEGDRNAWGIFGDWMIAGPHSVQIQYVKAGSTGGNAGAAGFAANAGFATSGTSALVFNGGAGNTGASMWGLQYKFQFSKRTNVNVAYSEIRNDSAATYGYHITHGTGILASYAGQTNKAWGLTIDHRF